MIRRVDPILQEFKTVQGTFFHLNNKEIKS